MTTFATARLATEKAVFRPALPLCFLPGMTEMRMATKRKQISKKLRFEVFKRDGFKCQYCGASAPDVLLDVDHIQPVSKDGTNDILNLITSCKACNSGKSDRTLDDSTAVKKQQAQLAELQERRDQLEMMLNWRSGLRDIESDQVQAIADAWSEAAVGWHLNEKGLKTARQLLKKHGLQRVLDAIETAGETYVKVDPETEKGTTESVEKAWSKVGGVCALSAMPDDERRLYYVKAILKNRLNYVPYDVIDDLRHALKAGVAVELMEREAKNCRNWNAFSGWLMGLV